MRLLWRARSNPVACWWAFLSTVSSANIALWFLLYRQFHAQPAGGLGAPSGVQLMLFLCAAYVFGCAFRSFLPRADVQRICLFDTWLSSVVVGRSVATIAEVCFAMQWALVLRLLGETAGVDSALNVARVVVPLILLAQCCSWYGVLTTNYLANAIENSIWAVTFLAIAIALCRLLPQFDGPVCLGLLAAIVGIGGYLAFLTTVDVPMYVTRWQHGLAAGGRALPPLEGLRDAATRWVVIHDFAEWKDEIPWMSLYFTAAVWASLALCLVYALGDRLPGYRTAPAAQVPGFMRSHHATLDARQPDQRHRVSSLARREGP
ncbi:MAG TPA: hypothetical protein VJ740_16535 [Hyphomicrobiaceae bacterium]|nr:hypothetical protein [Hyphomicrobiaceae bacterium]